MFWHLFKYKIKHLIRSKDETFWIIIFPLILGTCFNAAFGNITTSEESFHTIDVAIVLEQNTNTDMIKSTFDAMSESSEDEEALLSIKYTDTEEAEALLKNKKITGIIKFEDNTPSLTIREEGINESILKEVLDKYIQTSNVITSIAISNNDNISETELNNILSGLTSEANHIKTKKLTDGNTDYITDYFYSLIAMTSLFGSLLGVTCAKQMKANLSALGMRKNLAPVNRLTIILSDFFASYTVLVVGDLLLIAYLEFILKVNLGGKLGLVILTSLVGSLIGLSSGIFIGSIPKLSENMKMAINLSGSLFSSFLSGLMVSGIKYQIEKILPIVNRLNPATLITDALYSLNIYDTYDKFSVCMITLVIYSIIFCTLSYLMTRREQYACL